MKSMTMIQSIINPSNPDRLLVKQGKVFRYTGM